MILADTSVWVDHQRFGVARLAQQLEENAVLMHPFIVGELASAAITSAKLWTRDKRLHQTALTLSLAMLPAQEH